MKIIKEQDRFLVVLHNGIYVSQNHILQVEQRNVSP